MLKRPVITPRKSPGAKFMKTGVTPVKIKQLKQQNASKYTAARMIEHSNYRRAFNMLYKNFRGAKKAIHNLLKTSIRKEMQTFLKCGSLLAEECTMDTISKFNWTRVLLHIKDEMPIMYTALSSSITTPKNETAMLSTIRDLKPVIGLCTAILLHARFPRKFKLLQGINSIELWRNGAQRKLFQHFNSLGLCMSRTTTMQYLSRLRVHADTDLLDMVKELEEMEQRGPDDTIPAIMSAETTDVSSQENNTEESSEALVSGSDSVSRDHPSVSIESTDEEIGMEAESEDDTQSESIGSGFKELSGGSEASCPGFTIVWDNVGKQVKARHQNTEKQNRMMLWALAYSAKNRIETSALDSLIRIPAADIPLSSIVPDATDLQCIQDRLRHVVSRIIIEYIPFFQENMRNAAPKHVRHHHWRESSQKSDVINLGVLQEDPSSIAGTINIIEHLHKYVPNGNNGLMKIICYGDALSCERHNDAHKARANGATPRDRLQGLEPAAQEFHKRMLLMQDTMDTFFNGSSITEKGTLCHLRNVFGHRNVTKDVGSSFNHVSDFLHFVTVGYTVLKVMDILNMPTISAEPIDWCDMDAMSFEQKKTLLKDLAAEVVAFVWRDIAAQEVVVGEKEKPYEFCICKEDKDVPMIECSGTSCKDKWFHLECIEMDEEDVPDDDWFCTGCTKRSKRSRKVRQNKKENVDIDHVHEYISSLLLTGLLDQTRRDCIRANDGPMTMRFWKYDLIQFHNRNHTKYLILAHRLISAINGWLPQRLQKDLIWNRTVNLSGGPGRNLEMDLVNEMLNKEFKESLKDAGGNLTEETVARHSQFVGHLGRQIDTLYENVTGVQDVQHVRTSKKNIEQDLSMFTAMMKKENVFQVTPGRSFRSFPDFQYHTKCMDPGRMHRKLIQLGKRLDRLVKITGQ